MGSIRDVVEYQCTDCAGELDHCHGSLLAHVDGTSECTAYDCRDHDPARHALSSARTELTECGGRD